MLFKGGDNNQCHFKGLLLNREEGFFFQIYS